MKVLVGAIVMGFVLLSVPQPAEAGALRWVAKKTWQCPVIKAAVKGAAKGAVVAIKAVI